MTLISVVIPVYNAADTLPATLASLTAQIHRDWQAILVEDGSTDASWAIARSLADQDPRLKLLRNPGKGPSAARNHGARHANGDILAFCDADDLWERTKLRDVATALAAPDTDATFGQIAFFREDPQIIRTRSRVPAGPVTVPMLMGENPVCTLSNLSLRRATFQTLGGFREDIVHNEDLEFLIRLVGAGHRLIGTDAQHVLYRLSPTGLSADLTAMRAGRRSALATAARLGFRPSPASEAVHLRYLARRALRLGAPAHIVRRLVRDGCRTDASAFLRPLRRGGLIALAALLLPFLPRRIRRFLFSN